MKTPTRRVYSIYSVDLTQQVPSRGRRGLFVGTATIDNARQLRLIAGKTTYVFACHGDGFTHADQDVPVADVFRIDSGDISPTPIATMLGSQRLTWTIRFDEEGMHTFFVVADDLPAGTSSKSFRRPWMQDANAIW